MKKRLYWISPRLTMVLAALALVFSLYFLWSSLHFAMPTRYLALQKAEAEMGLPQGDWTLYRPSLDYAANNAGGWYFSRRGDAFYIASPFRNDSALWDAMRGPYRVTPYAPWPLDWLYTWEEGRTGMTDILLVATPDPAVARVALVWGGQSVDCAESAPDSGFWVGSLQEPDTEERKTLSVLVRAYTADGALLPATP